MTPNEGLFNTGFIERHDNMTSFIMPHYLNFIKSNFLSILTVDGKLGFSLQGACFLKQGRMISLATNGGAVVIPANRKYQSRQGDPGPGILCRSLVLLAMSGRNLLVAHVPLELGWRVSSCGNAFKFEVFTGRGSDLNWAGIITHALDDYLAWWLCQKERNIF